MGTGGELIWMLGGGVFLLALVGIAFAVIVLIRWRTASDDGGSGPGSPPSDLPPDSPAKPTE